MLGSKPKPLRNADDDDMDDDADVDVAPGALMNRSASNSALNNTKDEVAVEMEDAEA